jgi:hypothetical protein
VDFFRAKRNEIESSLFRPYVTDSEEEATSDDDDTSFPKNVHQDSETNQGKKSPYGKHTKTKVESSKTILKSDASVYLMGLEGSAIGRPMDEFERTRRIKELARFMHGGPNAPAPGCAVQIPERMISVATGVSSMSPPLANPSPAANG